MPPLPGSCTQRSACYRTMKTAAVTARGVETSPSFIHQTEEGRVGTRNAHVCIVSPGSAIQPMPVRGTEPTVSTMHSQHSGHSYPPSQPTENSPRLRLYAWHPATSHTSAMCCCSGTRVEMGSPVTPAHPTTSNTLPAPAPSTETASRPNQNRSAPSASATRGNWAKRESGKQPLELKDSHHGRRRPQIRR